MASSLQLHAVKPGQGLLWVRSGFALFFRRPLAFTGLFAMFLFAMLLAMTLPWIGAVLSMAAWPLLSLGFMLATRSALAGGAVHPGHFAEPLRAEPPRRRKMLALCAAHAAAAVGVFLVWDAFFGEPFRHFLQVLGAGNVSQEDIARAYLDDRVQWSLLALTTLWAVLISAPFWHAAALVHWAGHGVAQALFTSTVALWRTKGAFAMYLLGWAGVSLLFSVLSGILFGMLGLAQAAAAAALPAMLMFSTAFYVSLYFSFTDTFGSPA